MESESKDIKRIRAILQEHPDIEFWFVGANKRRSLLAKKALEEHGIVPKRTLVFSQSTTTIDGLLSDNALIILCNGWRDNPVIKTTAFDYYLHRAKLVIQIGEI